VQQSHESGLAIGAHLDPGGFTRGEDYLNRATAIETFRQALLIQGLLTQT